MYATFDPSHIDSGLIHASGGPHSNKYLSTPSSFQTLEDESDPPYVPKDGGGSQCTPGDHDILHALRPSSLGWPSQSYHPVLNTPFSGYQTQVYDYLPQSHSPTYPVLPTTEHSAYTRTNNGHHWADHGVRTGSPYHFPIGSHHDSIDSVLDTHPPFSSTPSFQGQGRPYRGHTGGRARSSGLPVIPMPYAQRSYKHESPKDVHLTGYSDSSKSGIPDAGSFLRNVLNIPAHIPIHLSSLRDPRDKAGRPPYSIPQLAAVAIYSNPRNKTSAAEIRQVLMDRFEYFRHNESQLKETLKHALSHHLLFQRAPRAHTEPGKGGFWYLEVSNPRSSRSHQRTARRNSFPIKHTKTVLATFSDRASAQRQRSLPARVDKETTFSTPSSSYIHGLYFTSAYSTDSPPFPDSFGGNSYSSTFPETGYMLYSHSR
ncbi:hypothetical protein DFS33DRAFT_1381463 [Desarmillaria ectypa]|nr:hypothetical protein DFS33DRAFT_1381463 [Desarmillaria ectypa]